MTRPAPASPESTIEALLTRSGRKAVPIRKTFVQQGPQGKPSPGPLARLVHSHDERALKMYLLFLGAASHEPWDVTLPAGVWARAAGIAAASGVSKVWRRLESHGLVGRSRKGRKAAITALYEDGSMSPYTHPSSSHDRYFQLSFAFWTAEERWYRTLDLSETALLLVALSLPDRFILPSDKARRWYGLSSDTVERGLHGLHQKSLLRIERESKPAPLTALGYTLERRYTLRQPFGPKSKSATDSAGDLLASLIDDWRTAKATTTKELTTEELEALLSKLVEP